MRPLTNALPLAVLATTLVAATPAAHAGAVNGIVDYTASFSGNGITAVAGLPAATAQIMQGTVSGPSVQFAVLEAEGTDFAGSVRATSRVDGSVGPGSSSFGFRVEAWSGEVQVRNTGTTASVLNVLQSLLYSLTTSGTGSESLGMVSGLERQNALGTWDFITLTGFNIGNDDTRRLCAPACVGTSSYAMDAGDTWTLRLHTTLRGNMAQPVPEPGGLALAAAALGAVALVRQRQAGAGPALSAS